MGRYDPLRDYLARQPGERVPLTFREIEAVVGFPLPKSKQYPAWWSNNPSNNPMTKVWLEAGFVTEQVDISGARLTFRRARNIRRGPGEVVSKLRAALGGTVSYAPGLDLTAPSGETWDAERE